MSRSVHQRGDVDRPTAAGDDLDRALPAVPVIIDRAARLIPHLPAF